VRTAAVTIIAIAMLAGCSSEPANEAAVEPVVSDTTKAAEFDEAAERPDPLDSKGEPVNAESLQAAITAACEGEVTIGNASCKAGDNPGEFVCDYALKGGNAFDMKDAVIAEDGDGWKLNDAPNHCEAQ